MIHSIYKLSVVNYKLAKWAFNSLPNDQKGKSSLSVWQRLGEGVMGEWYSLTLFLLGEF